MPLQVAKVPLKALANVGAAWRRDRLPVSGIAPGGDGPSGDLIRFLNDMRLDDERWLARADALVERCRATASNEEAGFAQYAPGLGVIDVGLRLRRADVIDRGIALLRAPAPSAAPG